MSIIFYGCYNSWLAGPTVVLIDDDTDVTNLLTVPNKIRHLTYDILNGRVY